MSFENRRGTRPQGASRVQQKHRDYSASRPDKFEQWVQWTDDNGVIAPALILYQWVRTNAPHKSFKNTSLGVMLKDDCIHVKDFTTDECFTFFDNRQPTAARCGEQLAEHRRVARIAVEQREAGYQDAARDATKRWLESTEAPATGYFARKGQTSTHGARWHQSLNCWIVLVTDFYGEILTVQKIYNKPAPNKFYLKGGRTAGGMVIIGSLINASRIVVTEGFATGGTLREETGETIACALSSGNLLAVCTAIRAAYPDIEIIVAGDSDRFAHNNVGRQKAIEAAAAVGGKYCFPIFSDDCLLCTDFNDVLNCDLSGDLS
jgi:phage/plasmid primase-like uncharacterized protein